MKISKRYSFFLLLLTVVFFAGCATTPTSQEALKPIDYSHYVSPRKASEVAKEFNAGYEDVWNATLETIQETGHPIQNINKESGSLTTDWLERGGAPFLFGMPFDTFKDRFSIRVFRVGNSGVKVGIRRSVQRIQGIKSIPKTSNGKIETWLLEEITSKITNQ